MRRLAAAILTAVLAAPLVGQTGSVQLDRTKQLIAVAAQKTEADVRAAIQNAARLEPIDRPKAIQKLKDTVALLQADQTLSESKKKTLLRVVGDRLRVVELGPDSPEVIAKQRHADAARRQAEKSAAERAAAEKALVKENLEAVAKLRKEGKIAEANRLAAEFAAKNPSSVAAQALTNQKALDSAVAEYERSTKDRQTNVRKALNSIDDSAVPIADNISFPADWKEKTAKRASLTAPSEEEKALVKSLQMRIDANFKNSRLQDVLDYIANATNRTIILDPSAATDANVNYDSPINFTAREPLATRTVLRSILSTYNLTFVVQDGVIHITTPQKARDMMTTKVYYLGDLVAGLGPYGGAATIGAANEQIQVVQNISAIVAMITGAVDPLSWERAGGMGHLGFNLPTLSLTVRQSQEVQVMVRSAIYGKK